MLLSLWVDCLEPRCLFSRLGPDVTFGDAGYVFSSGAIYFAGASGGGLLTGVSSGGSYNSQTQIKRLAANGTADASFQTIVRRVDELFVIADHHGRPVTAEKGNYGAVAVHRYNTRGVADAGFGTAGLTTCFPNSAAEAGTEATVIAVAAGPDDSVYVLTTFWNGSEIDDKYGVTKLTPKGAVDLTFGVNGTAWTGKAPESTLGSSTAWRSNLFIDKYGRAHVAMSQGYENGTVVRRLTALGQTDPTFSRAGNLYLPASVDPAAMTVDTAGRLLTIDRLGENNAARGRVLRFDFRGRADRTFGTNGAVLPVNNVHSTADGQAHVVALPNGVIVAQLDDYLVYLGDSGQTLRRGVVELPSRVQVAAVLPDGGILAGDWSVSNSPLTRLVPVPVAAVDQSGRLHITGTESADAFRLRPVGPPGRIEVRSAGVRVGLFNGVTAITADLFDGNDLLQASAVTVPMTVDAGAGDDAIATGSATDTVQLGTGNNTLDAGAGGGRIETTSGIGNSPRNVIGGAGGSRDVWTVSVASGRPRIALTGRSGVVTLAAVCTGSTMALNLSRGVTVDGSSGDDSILTGRGDDIIRPGDGNDTIDSGAGDDAIETRGGVARDNDFYQLGPGDDSLLDTTGNNTVYGGAGRDTITTGDGNDLLDGGPDDDTLKGGAGINHLLNA